GGMGSAAAIVAPLYDCSYDSGFVRDPRLNSQGTKSSSRKFISILIVPSPAHASQRPPLTLNENRPGPYPRTFASSVSAKILRMRSQTPVYVAGFDRGVRPIGPWSTCTTLSRCSRPSTRRCRPATCRAPLRWLAITVYRMEFTSVDLPEPDTPDT